ncbi:hypothetical protein [Oceanobacillus sp. CAU 1775]
MSKRKYLSYLILAVITGLFFIPALLDWLGVPFTFANVLYWVFGEPNVLNRIIILVLTGIFVLLVGRSSYKTYKKLT